ncbi:pentapeptide repeat-containing protein [Nocardia grenadensis]|uniref:pentapeptide repeat-containing protein n=1 Tax=Nocardia grenadensis TaxID=931537 RepID=UPI001C3FE25A|nr:pentapeptide repeat-containing protein [Nocardia grenadensis]
MVDLVFNSRLREQAQRPRPAHRKSCNRKARTRREHRLVRHDRRHGAGNGKLYRTPGVNLQDACLARANPRGAYLHRADLTRTDLTGADISTTTVEHTALIGATRTGAKLLDLTDLEEATWSEATRCVRAGSPIEKPVAVFSSTGRLPISTEPPPAL